MLATVKNYDLICYQLRNNLYSQLDNPLKKDLHRLSMDINAIIKSGKKVQAQPMAVLAKLFNFRIKAFRWLATDSNFDYLQAIGEISPQIEEIKTDKRLEVLTENLLFALRCNRRVVESMFHSNQISSDSFTSNLAHLPIITYQQFIASLAFTIPDGEVAQKMLDWTNASLHIEFVMLAADLIYDGELEISDKAINELAFLVSDAAQEYSALATELGIINPRSNRQPFSQFSFDKSFIKEQSQLADLGLDDFALNFPD